METHADGNGNWKLTKCRLRQYLRKMSDRDREKMTVLWSKPDLVDRVYYEYYQAGEPGYRQYMDRYEANQKFLDRIREIFREDIFELDAAVTLELWEILDENHASQDKHVLFRMRQSLAGKQKDGVRKKLQKYANPGIVIREEHIRAYLELLTEQKKRERQLQEAKKRIPDKILLYLQTQGDRIPAVHDGCRILDYCAEQMKSFHFPKEETLFWKDTLVAAATAGSSEIWTEIKNLVTEEEMGE